MSLGNFSSGGSKEVNFIRRIFGWKVGAGYTMEPTSYVNNRNGEMPEKPAQAFIMEQRQRRTDWTTWGTQSFIVFKGNVSKKRHSRLGR